MSGATRLICCFYQLTCAFLVKLNWVLWFVSLKNVRILMDCALIWGNTLSSKNLLSFEPLASLAQTRTKNNCSSESDSWASWAPNCRQRHLFAKRADLVLYPPNRWSQPFWRRQANQLKRTALQLASLLVWSGLTYKGVSPNWNVRPISSPSEAKSSQANS